MFSIDVEQDNGEVREFALCAISEASKISWIDSVNSALAPFRTMLEASANSVDAPAASMEKHIMKVKRC